MLWVAGTLSGFLDNIALTLVFIPILMDIVPLFGPYGSLMWIALILGTNIGGDLTPFGSPTSLVTFGFMKEQGFYIEFKEFFKISLIIGFANLAFATSYLVYIYYLAPAIASISYLIFGIIILVLIGMKSYKKYKGL